jgi:hypothetical protein
MNKTRWSRVIFSSCVSLAVLFQAAFALELHSPLPSDLVLWSLFVSSVACAVAALLVRNRLTANAKISYSPERTYRIPQLEAEESYLVVGTYCVILCRQPSFPVHYPRIKSFYLSEASADQAVMAASSENPHWRVVGVEPRNLSARNEQIDPLQGLPDWHVA